MHVKCEAHECEKRPMEVKETYKCERMKSSILMAYASKITRGTSAYAWLCVNMS